MSTKTSTATTQWHRKGKFRNLWHVDTSSSSPHPGHSEMNICCEARAHLSLHSRSDSKWRHFHFANGISRRAKLFAHIRSILCHSLSASTRNFPIFTQAFIVASGGSEGKMECAHRLCEFMWLILHHRTHRYSRGPHNEGTRKCVGFMFFKQFRIIFLFWNRRVLFIPPSTCSGFEPQLGLLRDLRVRWGTLPRTFYSCKYRNGTNKYAKQFSSTLHMAIAKEEEEEAGEGGGESKEGTGNGALFQSRFRCAHTSDKISKCNIHVRNIFRHIRIKTRCALTGEHAMTRFRSVSPFVPSAHTALLLYKVIVPCHWIRERLLFFHLLGSKKKSIQRFGP